MNPHRLARRTAFALCYAAAVAAVTLLAFEGIYRSQVIDTYLPELRAYNSDSVLNMKGTKGTILAMGDSFTAGEYSYPSHLRRMLPEYRIVNAGVPGTGVVQAALIAPRRFEAFTPSVLIYQVYVGNDLINIRYPLNWTAVSPLRNLYGLVADRLRSVSYLNYRLGQLRYAWRRPPVTPDSAAALLHAPFSPVTYSPIQKRYIRADPSILEGQIVLSKDRTEDFEILLRWMKTLLSYCARDKCEAYILVIPHACQVHPRYLEHMQRLGARFRHPGLLPVEEYPFVARIRQAFAGAPGVQVLNPLRELQAREKEGQVLFLYNDGHLNPEGQEVVAAFLKARLGQPPPTAKPQAET